MKKQKVVIISDLHGEFVDNNAFGIVKTFLKYYKPDILVINGDLVDFYGLSKFNKNPDRKNSLIDELEKVKNILQDIRSIIKKTKVYYLEGNHEVRLQSFLWANPELKGLDSLNIKTLFDLDKYNIEFVKVDNDYWRTSTGHLKLSNMLIMHGDSRLNGASLSKFSGYSAKNTMFYMQSNVAIGHNHRLALIFHSTTNGVMVGMETGCLCKLPGIVNWQQGFVSFEIYKNKSYNHRLYKICNGCLIIEQYIYNKSGRNKIV